LLAQHDDPRAAPSRRRQHPGADRPPRREAGEPPDAVEPREPHADPDELDGAGPPGMQRPPRPFLENLSEQERAELLQFIRENFPEGARELEALADYDPQTFQRRLGRMFPRLRQLMMELRNDPEAGRIGLEIERREMQIRERVRQYAESTDPNRRNELRAQTRALLEEQFELRRQRMAHEIAKLEQRLQQLRERVQNVQQHREKVIDARLGNLLNEPPAPRENP
jgi:hypothetical protein